MPPRRVFFAHPDIYAGYMHAAAGYAAHAQARLILLKYGRNEVWGVGMGVGSRRKKKTVESKGARLG